MLILCLPLPTFPQTWALCLRLCTWSQRDRFTCILPYSWRIFFLEIICKGHLLFLASIPPSWKPYFFLWRCFNVPFFVDVVSLTYNENCDKYIYLKGFVWRGEKELELNKVCQNLSILENQECYRGLKYTCRPNDICI